MLSAQVAPSRAGRDRRACAWAGGPLQQPPPPRPPRAPHQPPSQRHAPGAPAHGACRGPAQGLPWRSQERGRPRPHQALALRLPLQPRQLRGQARGRSAPGTRGHSLCQRPARRLPWPLRGVWQLRPSQAPKLRPLRQPRRLRSQGRWRPERAPQGHGVCQRPATLLALGRPKRTMAA